MNDERYLLALMGSFTLHKLVLVRSRGQLIHWEVHSSPNGAVGEWIAKEAATREKKKAQ